MKKLNQLMAIATLTALTLSVMQSQAMATGGFCRSAGSEAPVCQR